MPSRTSLCLFPGRKPFGYAIDLEVLMSIPLAAPACIRALADDLGLVVREINPILNKLARDYGVKIHLAGHRWNWGAVQVPRSRHASVLEATEEYYHRVYHLRTLRAWQRREISKG